MFVAVSTAYSSFPVSMIVSFWLLICVFAAVFIVLISGNTLRNLYDFV